MPFVKSLGNDASVRHIVALNPAAGRALIEFHAAALRNASGLPSAGKGQLFSAEDEAFFDGLVPAGHASTPGYTDAQFR